MLSELDVKILLEFSKLKEDEESSTWEIMKKIFRGKKSQYLNIDIKQRIIRMAKFGLFKINGDKIRTYTMDSNRVFYKTFNFPCGRRKGIAVIVDGKSQIYEL